MMAGMAVVVGVLALSLLLVHILCPTLVPKLPTLLD